jgi:hypothetical protein
MLARIAPGLSGLLFGLGLGISGMTLPAKVVGFLDVLGDWDPSLAFVMLGAIAVYMPLYRMIVGRPAPLFAAGFALPTARDIDARLVVGAAVFGVGWGLAGYCPGPGITALGAGSGPAVIFVLAMLAGMILYRAVNSLLIRGKAAAAASLDARTDQ